MNKIMLSLFLIMGINVTLPTKYVSSANAGVIGALAKKTVSGTIDLILKSSSEKIMNYQIDKLIKYIEKHPEHKEYIVMQIEAQISKYPKYSDKGRKLLDYIK